MMNNDHALLKNIETVRNILIIAYILHSRVEFLMLTFSTMVASVYLLQKYNMPLIRYNSISILWIVYYLSVGFYNLWNTNSLLYDTIFIITFIGNMVLN